MIAGRPGRGALLTFLALALALLAPTVNDFGLTYDEPAYRYSQLVSVQWWQGLVRARRGADLAALLSPDALLYYWPYARHGINFHPPLAGQMNLLTYGVLGGVLKDIPARRMASVAELAATATLIFGFIGRRYGTATGAAAGLALLLMPRIHGQAHLIDTDTPGLLLWVAGTFAFWKGLYEPDARRWRVAVGVIAGLAFVEKMAAVFFLMPLLVWLLLRHFVPALRRPRARGWLNADTLTLGLLLVPLAISYLEIRRLAKLLPPPQFVDLFVHRPPSRLPGAVLLAPVGIWWARRAIARFASRRGRTSTERPAVETLQAILAFGPVVGWLGNPAWWRETFVRLAHYYTLNTAREGALPDIRNVYFGQIFTFSLPPSNGWVLLAITVPASILAAAGVGMFCAARRIVAGDPLPAFVVLNLVTFPILRMLPTPAHDGVRLMLPTMAFTAIVAGWGIKGVGDGLAQRARWLVPRDRTHRLQPEPAYRGRWTALSAGLFLVPAALELAAIHPFELSYYNPFIGGPRGAWRRGCELSYWYDAFTPATIRELNRRLPPHAQLTFLNDLSAPIMVPSDLQSLGALRSDVVLGIADADQFPFAWLLTQDSKAMPLTRLLYQMTPWLAVAPRQLGGARVATVADPVAVSRAWALRLLAEGGSRPRKAGDPANRVPRPSADATLLDWARRDPDGLIAAAGALAAGEPDRAGRGEALRAHLARFPNALAALMRCRPVALTEAARMLAEHPDQVRAALESEPFLDPRALGGYLDRDLPASPAGNQSGAEPGSGM